MEAAELKAFLARRKKETIIEKTRVPSAVLLPLFQKDGKWHIVFIKRSFWVPTHQGQVAFPGGSRHVHDKSLLETALRETHEEIGVKPEDIEVLGELDDQLTTTSNFILTPFVGVIPWPYEFTLSKREVDDVFIAPVHTLMEKSRMRPENEKLNGQEVPSFAYYYKGKRIWGATARVLKKFFDILTQIEVEKSRTA
jgi:8-oxo-dGTP pyrophosphatase MutT (NUDIX family)